MRASIWGEADGNRSTFERLRRDDVVLFYGNQRFVSRAQVTLLLSDADRLADHLWEPVPKSGSYRHVFFQRNVEDLQTPWSGVRDYREFNSTYFLQRQTVLDETPSAGPFPILSEFDQSFGSLDASVRNAVEESGAESAPGSLESGQSFQSSTIVRKTLEERSMALAERNFRRQGFHVSMLSRDTLHLAFF